MNLKIRFIFIFFLTMGLSYISFSCYAVEIFCPHITPKSQFLSQTKDENDNDELTNNDLLEIYSPIFYLHKDESAFPITAEEYFTGKTSSVKNKSGHVIIPAGKVTMQALYNLRNVKMNDLYIDIGDCVTRGSDTRYYTQDNILKTPVYGIAFKGKNEKGEDVIYLQYLLLFGLNKPYIPGYPFFKLDIADISSKVAILAGRDNARKVKEKITTDVLNLHNSDLEHITLELDAVSKKLNNIYYGSHGRREGVWLPADHQYVVGEGTHPVIYIAKGGHGTYPLVNDDVHAGVYIRIFGMANDEIASDIRWEPEIVRIYTNKSKKFNPKTMGWLYFPGNYGVHGVSNAANQSWFANPNLKINGDIGRPIEEFEKTFCPRKENGKYDLSCLLKKIKNAKIPK